MPTVQLDNDSLASLDELRDDIHAAAGIDVSRQALLTHLIDEAYQSEAAVVDSFCDATDGTGSAAWLGQSPSSAEDIEEAEIDEILYVEEQLPDDPDQSTEHNP